MSGRGRELIAANESTVMAKSLLDPVVVEDSQGDGGLSDSASTDEGDWDEVLCEIDYLFDQLVASEERSREWRWRFPGHAGFKCKTAAPLMASIANLA